MPILSPICKVLCKVGNSYSFHQKISFELYITLWGLMLNEYCRIPTAKEGAIDKFFYISVTFSALVF